MTADVVSAQDYYPFGMVMPARQKVSDYRFGFNGKEKDNEIKGEGNSLDFGARVYDPRLGKWLSPDPLMHKYSGFSPYNAFGDNAIMIVDKEGKDLTLGGKSISETKEALLSMLTSSDIRNRVSLNDMNEITFNTAGLTESQKADNSVQLLINLTAPGEKYLFEVSTVAQGTDRENDMPKEYIMLNDGNPYGPADMNFSMTDRGDEAKMLKRGVTQQTYDLSNMKPASGYQGQATVTPNKNALYEKDPNGAHSIKTKDATGKVQEKTYSLKKYGATVFHTLQEVYNRTHFGMNLPDAHDDAVAKEKALPEGSPAKSKNPGEIQTDQKK